MGGSTDTMSRPNDPWFFVKTSAHSVIGDSAAIHLPAKTQQVDWEAELAVVIGKRARDVPAERAAGVIAGFTIVNDLSARDLMMRATTGMHLDQEADHMSGFNLAEAVP